MTNKKIEGNKVLLEGAARGGYDHIDIPFPAYLTSALNSLGYNANYTYLCGTSGAAFRLIWDADKWNPGNSDIMLMAEDPIEPFRRAFASVGYQFELIGKPKEEINPDSFDQDFHKCVNRILSKAEFEENLIKSIDEGIPVIAFGVIGPPECCLITGYEDSGKLLLGWNFFQDIPDFHNIAHDSSGYFRKPGWYENTPYYILIGNKDKAVQVRATYIASLEFAVKIAHADKVRGKYSGLAAYKAWADAIRDEAGFYNLSDEEIAFRAMVHNDLHGCMYFGRRQAAAFIRMTADCIPEISNELLQAAQCYDEGVKIMEWNESGRFADPKARAQFAEYILKAQNKEAEAVRFIEKALQRIK